MVNPRDIAGERRRRRRRRKAVTQDSHHLAAGSTTRGRAFGWTLDKLNMVDPLSASASKSGITIKKKTKQTKQNCQISVIRYSAKLSNGRGCFSWVPCTPALSSPPLLPSLSVVLRHRGGWPWASVDLLTCPAVGGASLPSLKTFPRP